MITKNENGTESTSLWASTKMNMRRKYFKTIYLTWSLWSPQLWTVASPCYLTSTTSCKSQKRSHSWEQNIWAARPKNRKEDISPHLNSCNYKPLKSMMIKKDSDGGCSEEAKTEQDTVPRRLLWEMIKKSFRRCENLQMFNISDDLLQKKGRAEDKSNPDEKEAKTLHNGTLFTLCVFVMKREISTQSLPINGDLKVSRSKADDKNSPKRDRSLSFPLPGRSWQEHLRVFLHFHLR